MPITCNALLGLVVPIPTLSLPPSIVIISVSEALAIYPKPDPVLRKPKETKPEEVFPPTEI